MQRIDADPGKCAVCKLPWQPARDMAAQIESDAKEIARLNSAFDDCAENANAVRAEVKR